MASIEIPQSITAALDYLPVAVRAAERNPGNDILWSESYRAQRAVIEYADTHLPEALAADVQATVGRIARLAVHSYAFAITEPLGAMGNYRSSAVLTEFAKSHIRTLLDASR